MATEARRREGPLARLPRAAALALLALTAALMAWSAWAALPARVPANAGAPAIATANNAAGEGDMALYARIAARTAAGEDYYAVAVTEQRVGNYPVRPFVTVRLPTLAMLHRWIGSGGVALLCWALLAGVVALTVLRLRGRARPPEVVAAGVFALLGGAAVAAPLAPLIHELLAGLLLSLSLLLYRPHRWWPALIAAALALTVRELAVPFLLLWAVFAAANRRWRELAAVVAVIALFALGLALHAQAVAAQLLPGDPASPGWSAMAGLSLPLAALSRLTALLVLPAWLAAPLALLPLLGWLGLGGRLGLFAALWSAGFMTAMALFARPENFYWAQLVLPAYMIGFAFVPRALGDLLVAARLKQS